MATYYVNTKDSSYSTASSISAARVFVSQLRSGRDPSVYAVVDKPNGVSIRPVYDWANNVEKMQKLIARTAK